MAALRVFTRTASTTCGITSRLSPSNHTAKRSCVAPIVAQIQHRWSSYKTSTAYTKPENYTEYEISKSPDEWKYVEFALPHKVVPKPPTGDAELPSGWKPMCASPKDNPYFIERTRNYMQPVYLDISFRGTRKITRINKIQGDIWALERDIQSYLLETMGKNVGSQIHEMANQLKFHGDHVSKIKRWMDIKGF